MNFYKTCIKTISLFLLLMIILYCIFHLNDTVPEQENVIIQDKQNHDALPDSSYCTDNKKDCQFNQDFFLDTWLSGKVHQTPKKYDIDGKLLQ